MPDISVKDQRKKLVELQKVDSEIYELKQVLHEKPIALEVLKGQFEVKKARLKQLEEQQKQLQVARKDLELELQTREDHITRSNSKLSELKTNKEYSAMISEIESVKADKSQIEEKILKSYDESDRLNAEIEKENKVVGEEEKEYLQQKKEVEAEVQRIKGEMDSLNAQRQTLTPDIEPATLSRYEQVLNHKDGLGIVPVQGSSCGGCFMNLNPQIINALKMNEGMVDCQFCTRMLYIEEDL